MEELNEPKTENINEIVNHPANQFPPKRKCTLPTARKKGR